MNIIIPIKTNYNVIQKIIVVVFLVVLAFMCKSLSIFSYQVYGFISLFALILYAIKKSKQINSKHALDTLIINDNSVIFRYADKQELVINKSDINSFNIDINIEFKRMGRCAYTDFKYVFKVITDVNTYEIIEIPTLKFTEKGYYKFFLKILDNKQYIPNFSWNVSGNHGSEVIVEDINKYAQDGRTNTFIERLKNVLSRTSVFEKVFLILILIFCIFIFIFVFWQIIIYSYR